MNKRPDADKAPTAADHEALEQWLRTQFGPEPVGRRAYPDEHFIYPYPAQRGPPSYTIEVTQEAYEFETGAQIAAQLDRQGIADRLRREPRVHLRYQSGGRVVPSPAQPS